MGRVPYQQVYLLPILINFHALGSVSAFLIWILIQEIQIKVDSCGSESTTLVETVPTNPLFKNEHAAILFYNPVYQDEI
jgi:hypothetical protein